MQQTDPTVEVPPSLLSTRFPGKARLLVLVLAIPALAMLDWLSIRTQRLYLSRNPDPQYQSGGLQERFAQRDHQITPEIVTSDDQWNAAEMKWTKSTEARFSFAVHLLVPHALDFAAVPTGKDCAFEIYVDESGRRRQLASETIVGLQSRRIFLPPCAGRLAFVSRGSMVWLDPRVSRLFLWPVYAAALLAINMLIWKSRDGGVPLSQRTVNWLTLTASLLVTLALVELVLRAVASRLPQRVLEARQGLGLVVPDPRFVESSRYEFRLRSNLNVPYEWRFGELVRYGVIAENKSPGIMHRYVLQTDREGFRNPMVRDKIDVAALGDSFTEATTVPAAESWPVQLEKLTGWAVQNYGTSGYGPQQELYVLRDFAIKHRPRVSVVAFYAGNDLFDAVEFERWQRIGTPPGHEPNGVKVAESFRNYQTLCLWGFAQTLGNLLRRERATTSTPVTKPSPPGSDYTARASFQEGLFQLPIKGKLHHFAWSPESVSLATSRADLENSHGWKLARQTFLEMNSVCVENGGRLVVMFIPTKQQVYWPLVERSLGIATIQQADDFYLAGWTWPPSGHIDSMQVRQNRLAQNELVADFCAGNHIPMLDLTPALQKEFEAGSEVYFADDGHWNAAGHETAAKELARFLQGLP